ncbi:MAG: alcohol dehydrogenase catalytic domain-containing protein, partial [Alphaproteobacteria bacterium]|nr:alcohol dehydrogenase catalytic domain-containing protein [Alphaproteobacteria bacterium]
SNELLVRIGGAGLCHSDLSIINGSIPRALPMVLGHEGAGEVVEIGDGVTDINVGDHVVFQFRSSCGRCRRCLEGRPALCEVAAKSKSNGELMAGGKRLSLDGVPIFHHSGISCMAEFAVVDRGTVVVVDKSLSLVEAAIFGCAVMTGVGAVTNTARVRPGDSVAIVGMGGVGLNALLGAVLAGAERIIAIDVSDDKLGLARQLGATETYNAKDADCVANVLEATKGGVDFAIETAGAIAAMETCYAILRTGGKVIAAGIPPVKESFSFKPAQLVSEERGILGSSMGSCVPVRDIPRYISLYQQGRLPVDKLIDAQVGFDGVNEGFDKLTSGTVVRQILVPGL